MEVENELRLKKKAKFYFENKIQCHIIKDPKGFLNGHFNSDIIDECYYWFVDRRFPKEEFRLFLLDIFDIKDYEEVGE